MVWVKLSEHGRGALANDGFATYGTQGTTSGMIMYFTVGQAIDIKELSVSKRTVAVGTNKTVWVPLDAQGCDVVCRYGQVAAAALVCK